jgi:surface protein
MSIRYGNKVGPLISRKSSFFKKNRFDGLNIKKPNINNWIRPSDWLPMPTILPSEEKIALLMPVFPQGSNFLAFTISGAYTVDWGDGVTENVASNVKAQHEYSYTDPDLNATVTSGGYKMAVVVITPQAGQNITSVDFNQTYELTGSTFPDTSPILEIVLSCPNLSTMLLGGEPVELVFCKNLISFTGINMGIITDFSFMFTYLKSLKNVDIKLSVADTTSYMFQGCISLTTVPLFNTSNVTSMNGMFSGCTSLTTVPLFNTSNATSTDGMFSGCTSLTTVPLFNTSNVTEMGGMFYGCTSLTTVPLFNTSNVTEMGGMFAGCTSLITVPLFNIKTSGTVNMASMFDVCTSLTTVPLFNTSNVTNMSYMFQDCTSLTTVPLFNTSNVTDMTRMFSGCTSLTTVPLFNIKTSGTVNMSIMFFNCISLTTVPLFNTSNVTNMSNMFNGCTSLTTVPLLISGAGTTTTKFNAIFTNCNSLTRAALSGSEYSISYSDCKLSKEELESVFNYLDTIGTSSQTITVTNNWGAPTPVTLTGTTTVGSTTISMANTTGIAVGMQVTGVGSPLTTASAVTFTDLGDLVNLASHGLSNGDEVSFATIVTTTGIVTNRIYYVVNATAGTFQVAATLGGPALPITTTGTPSGTLRYRTQVVSINPNVSITVSRPMTTSASNTLTFRQLRTGTALLKGWAVTA